MSKITDIVVTSYNRLDKLQRVLQYIYDRTRAPYRLHVIDDGSDDGSADFLIDLWRCGRGSKFGIQSLLLRGQNWGAHATLCSGFWLAFSNPVVVIPDDILVPQVDPCWLEQGLAAMAEYPRLGILDLNNPSANLGTKDRRRRTHREGPVQFCQFVGGAVAFARRSIMEDQRMALSWEWEGKERGPWRKRVTDARWETGWQIGYLHSVYCQHIGETSARRGGKRLRLVTDVDPVTLCPKEEGLRV